MPTSILRSAATLAATIPIGLNSPALAIQTTGGSILSQSGATLPAGRMIFDESSMTGLGHKSILISQMANFMSNGDMGVDMSTRPDYSNDPPSTITSEERQAILHSGLLNLVGPVFQLDGNSPLCIWYRSFQSFDPVNLPYGC